MSGLDKTVSLFKITSITGLVPTSSGQRSTALARVMRALCDLSRKYPLEVSLDWAGGDQLLYAYCVLLPYGRCNYKLDQKYLTTELGHDSTCTSGLLRICFSYSSLN